MLSFNHTYQKILLTSTFLQSLPEMNLRIKMIRNLSNPQRTERLLESPQKKIDHNNISPITMIRKRSKSQYVILKKQEESPRKTHVKIQPFDLKKEIFSKIKTMQSSPQQKFSQKIKSQLYQQTKEKTLFNLIPIKSTEYSEDPQKKTQQICKFPYFVSQSNQMVSMKQKLLQLKHRVKFNHSFPVLESIQDSINVNRACFTRKMKVQVSKKGNTSLNVHFEKDLSQYLQNNSPVKSKSQEKHYRPINLSYLMALQHKDQNSFDKHKRVQKMQQIKKNLKVVRKTNLKRLK